MWSIAAIAAAYEELAIFVLKDEWTFYVFLWLKEFLDLPSVKSGNKKDGKDGGLSTQFAVASGNYQSQLHRDIDYGFSILSVLAADKERQGEVIYYFNFPTLGIAIPMMSGDIIIFDSDVEHCSSNPKHPDDYIFSMYCKAETVDTMVRKKYREHPDGKAKDDKNKKNSKSNKRKKNTCFKQNKKQHTG